MATEQQQETDDYLAKIYAQVKDKERAPLSFRNFRSETHVEGVGFGSDKEKSNFQWIEEKFGADVDDIVVEIKSEILDKVGKECHVELYVYEDSWEIVPPDEIGDENEYVVDGWINGEEARYTGTHESPDDALEGAKEHFAHDVKHLEVVGVTTGTGIRPVGN